MVNKLRTVSAFAIGVLATGAILAGNARADVTAFDTTLVNGTYFGSGNPAGGWTVTTNGSGIEVGLRAKYRNGAQIDTPNDDYVVLPGACITSPCKDLNGPKPSLALWNFEFSIDLSASKYTMAAVKDYTFLNIQVWDGTTPVGSLLTFQPLLIPDNAVRDWGGAQNSENPGWFIPDFNPNADYTYAFDLRVGAAGIKSLAATHMDVVVTPEPTSVILLASVLVGVLMLIRRRQTA